ncbi:putative quinol monooxygenase [Poseidonocella sp. HB161398]|uniref:putative quinol monooxygenase n=1 Tax=Poseidonocella sp. HB161398 TaxID=2320855 RepID=UPI0014862A76|nr:antibiotic biosynthesis monooxygenase [Poseidonocella sp. HB161398]
MLVVHLRFTTAPEDRPRAPGTLLESAAEIRAMPGNIAFVAFAGPGDGTALGMLREWQTGADFDASRASGDFRAFGAAVRPLMIAPPSRRRFAATLLPGGG